ncbi:DUF4276 family protein [Stenotrophomonas lactitubi]|jgi:hypothetical protein|uniref:DUF4276 family protein n=1 Tax=Stenotrophomonas lactitubi TaxID=2045214 RepID=UPI0035C214D9
MADHLEILVEEPSMEAFLRKLLPRMSPPQKTFEIHPFQGKSDLLTKLCDRLRGYKSWLPDNWRIVVLVDRDADDCAILKAELERICATSGLVSRTVARPTFMAWHVVNRIAIEELEAWYFGEWSSVCLAYPRMTPNIQNKAGFRNSDSVAGGTWEAFERVAKRAGYFPTGLAKIQAAREVGQVYDHDNSSSASFNAFRDALLTAWADGQ